MDAARRAHGVFKTRVRNGRAGIAGGEGVGVACEAVIWERVDSIRMKNGRKKIIAGVT